MPWKRICDRLNLCWDATAARDIARVDEADDAAVCVAEDVAVVATLAGEDVGATSGFAWESTAPMDLMSLWRRRVECRTDSRRVFPVRRSFLAAEVATRSVWSTTRKTPPNRAGRLFPVFRLR